MGMLLGVVHHKREAEALPQSYIEMLKSFPLQYWMWAIITLTTYCTIYPFRALTRYYIGYPNSQGFYPNNSPPLSFVISIYYLSILVLLSRRNGIYPSKVAVQS